MTHNEEIRNVARLVEHIAATLHEIAGEPPVSFTLEDARQAAIRRAMDETGNNKIEAAKLLDVGPRSLYRWTKPQGERA